MKTLKSIGAILAGIIAVFALSTVTDMILETTGFMKIPFATNPVWLILLVILYRNIYVVISSYLTALLAPDKPMKHALIFGAIGFALGVAGTIIMRDEGPLWYPVSLVVLGVPCAWLGGWLKMRSKKRKHSASMVQEHM